MHVLMLHSIAVSPKKGPKALSSAVHIPGILNELLMR